MRQANDILGQILIVAFFIIMAATPLLVLILGVVNFVRAATRRGTIALQVLAALVIWTFLTYALVMIFIVVVFSAKYPTTPAQEWKATGLFFLESLVYAAVGAGLIYWTRRQAALSQTARPSHSPVE